jgi:hypothetical protein
MYRSIKNKFVPIKQKATKVIVVVVFTILTLSLIIVYLIGGFKNINFIQSNNISAQTAKAATQFPPSRDMLTWPFGPNSIWNVPIGSNAQYKAINLSHLYEVNPDHDRIIFTSNNDPLVTIQKSNNPKNGGNLPDQIHFPTGIKAPCKWNGITTVVLPDKITILQWNYFCYNNGAITYNDADNSFQYIKLDSDNNNGDNNSAAGAHGGAKMSGIGGTLRFGELTSNEPIHHVLKINLDQREFQKCNDNWRGFRWPALRADRYACDTSGAFYQNTQNIGLGMGSLLALPANTDINSLGLQTKESKKMAQALLDYGAYIADDSYLCGCIGWDIEDNGKGYSVEEETGNMRSGVFLSDMKKLLGKVALVDNNSNNNIGGGGAARAPAAPPFNNTQASSLSSIPTSSQSSSQPTNITYTLECHAYNNPGANTCNNLVSDSELFTYVLKINSPSNGANVSLNLDTAKITISKVYNCSDNTIYSNNSNSNPISFVLGGTSAQTYICASAKVKNNASGDVLFGTSINSQNTQNITFAIKPSSIAQSASSSLPSLPAPISSSRSNSFNFSSISSNISTPSSQSNIAPSSVDLSSVLSQSSISVSPSTSKSKTSSYTYSLPRTDISSNNYESSSTTLQTVSSLAVINNSDINNDKIVDSQQPNLAIIKNSSGSDLISLTLNKLESEDNSCLIPLDVSAVADTSLPKKDNGFSYPFGLIKFRIACNGTSQVKLRFFTDITDKRVFSVRKFGSLVPGDGRLLYYNLSNTAIDNQFQILDGRRFIEINYSLTDGMIGDDTTKDGNIIDPIGLAYEDNLAQSYNNKEQSINQSMNVTNIIIALIFVLFLILIIVKSQRKRIKNK